VIKQNITYKKTRVNVNVPYKIRKGKCLCCGKRGTAGNFTNLHHWIYKFETKQVKKNHLLALKNTTELCFTCHAVADCLNLLGKTDKKIIEKLTELRDEVLKKKNDKDNV
jgi:hypothetical protein